MCGIVLLNILFYICWILLYIGIGPHAELIWCNDFAAALTERQLARKKEETQRQEDVVTELTDVVETTMTNGAGISSSSSPVAKADEDTEL